jgi:hypothetical protein
MRKKIIMSLINKCQVPRLAWFSIPNHKKKKKITCLGLQGQVYKSFFFFFAKKVNIYCTSLISFFKKPMIARLVA